MDAKTYLRESERTAAGDYHGNLVDPAQLDFMLQSVVANGRWADRIKRALFYAKVGESVADRWKTTSLSHNPELKDLVHSMLGCVTESAEIAEHVRAVLTGAGNLDKVNVREELGDLLWYVALGLRYIDSDFEETFESNIAKLRVRFPDKFTEEAAIDRDLVSERLILEEVRKVEDTTPIDSVVKLVPAELDPQP